MRQLYATAVAFVITLSPSALCAAPFAALYLDGEGFQLADLAEIHKSQSLVQYKTVTVTRLAPLVADGPLEQMIHRKEADCDGARVRIVEMALQVKGKEPEVPPWSVGVNDWTEIDEAELRLVCSGDTKGRQIFRTVGAARAAMIEMSKKPE